MNKLIDFYKKYNLDKYVLAIILTFWIVYTLLNQNMYLYNPRELWNWDIAADLNFIEILKLMHYEGHTFLWYLVLKPFTHFDFCYPISMKFINFAFFLGALYILLVYSKINIFAKIMISISTPFLLEFPKCGQGYGLAILLLFTLTWLYEDRLKKPLLYAVLIFLASNCELPTAAGAFAFGAIFLYDLIRDNNYDFKSKKIITPLSIIICGWLLLLLQCVPLIPPAFNEHFSNFYNFKDFFFGYKDNGFYKFCSYILFVPILQVVLYFTFKAIKLKRWLFFMLVTFNSLIILFLFLFPSQHYQYYFLYVYLIIIYWLLTNNCPSFKSDKYAYVSMTIFVILASIIFSTALKSVMSWTDKKDYIGVCTERINELVPRGSTIYMVLDLTQGMIPTLKHDYILKTVDGKIIPSYDAYKGIWHDKFLNPHEIKTEPDENAYFLVSYGYLWKHYNDYTILVPHEHDIYATYILCKIKPKVKVKAQEELNYQEYIDQTNGISERKIPDKSKKKVYTKRRLNKNYYWERIDKDDDFTKYFKFHYKDIIKEDNKEDEQ